MTKLEMTIRRVSDLRDFYMKIKKEKSKNRKAGASPTDTAPRTIVAVRDQEPAAGKLGGSWQIPSP